MRILIVDGFHTVSFSHGSCLRQCQGRCVSLFAAAEMKEEPSSSRLSVETDHVCLYAQLQLTAESQTSGVGRCLSDDSVLPSTSCTEILLLPHYCQPISTKCLFFHCPGVHCFMRQLRTGFKRWLTDGTLISLMNEVHHTYPLRKELSVSGYNSEQDKIIWIP